MKNHYIVKLNTASGKTFYIRHYVHGIYTIDTDRNYAGVFTNKKTAAAAGKYFTWYQMSEHSTFEVIKIN